jgi:hypothetical protein
MRLCSVDAGFAAAVTDELSVDVTAEVPEHAAASRANSVAPQPILHATRLAGIGLPALARNPRHAL